jgi:hypothetical protein
MGRVTFARQQPKLITHEAACSEPTTDRPGIPKLTPHICENISKFEN